jgi:hypothetical protein
LTENKKHSVDKGENVHDIEDGDSVDVVSPNKDTNNDGKWEHFSEALDFIHLFVHIF